MRNEREHDGEKDQGRRHGVEHAEIDEAENADGHDANEVHFLAADPVGDVAGERDRNEGKTGSDQHRDKQQVTRGMQYLCAVEENKRREDVERRLLRHTRQGAEQDFLGLLLPHLEERRALDLLFRNEATEERRLADAEANPETDRNENNAENEGHAPSPRKERIARHLTEGENSKIGEEEPGWHAELRPGRDEAAMVVRPRPFHR